VTRLLLWGAFLVLVFCATRGARATLKREKIEDSQNEWDDGRYREAVQRS